MAYALLLLYLMLSQTENKALFQWAVQGLKYPGGVSFGNPIFLRMYFI